MEDFNAKLRSSPCVGSGRSVLIGDEEGLG